ncbi:MAG: hypothetical protein V8R89_06170 [Alphaproteobacteria bacterium]
MRKNSVTSAKEELLARLEGRLPVRGSDGREYYVRYNDNREELEEVPPPELRPLTEKDKAKALWLASGLRPQGIGAWEIAGEGLKGFGQGVVSGLGRVAGGATLGATDWLDRKTGGHLASLDADLQRSAEGAGLGGWNKAAKFASELGGNIQGAGGALVKGLSKAGLKGLKLASASGGLEGAAYGATGSDSMDELPENVAWSAALGAALPFGLHYGAKGAKWAARPVTEKATRYLGKRKLAKQLAKDSDFEDVNLGYIDDQLATRLNQVRNAENVSPVESARTSVTGERIGHIRDGRILRDKRSPDFMADVVDAALFSKQPHVIRGNIPENQVIFDSSNPANKVVVSKNSNTNGISVITTMKDKSLGKINKRLGGLPFPPYGANVTSDVSTAAGSKIPDFQPLNKSIIPQNMSAVNPAFKRSFVEALADENKRRTMRNAVMSGAEDLSERAKILSDRLERRNGGMYDADFEQFIKTPELSRAEEKYAGFMAKNGGQMMPEDKVADFYAQHPIAEDMIAEMRLIDPRAFAGIQPGSLAEFDMLKKRLREEAGNKVKVGVSRSGALKRAENDLKTLMDREFPGFRDVNRNFADARTTQDIFESRLKKGLTSVGGATVSPFWSGLLMSGMRRNAGRRLADGIVQTPVEVNINPLLSAGLSSAAYNNMRNKDYE